MNRRLPLLAAALCCACVSASRYKAKDDEARALDGQRRALETRSAELQRELTTSSATLAGLRVKLGDLETSNKDLKESLDANKSQLTQKVSALIAERDELARKASESEAARKAAEEARAAELAQAKKSFEDMAAGLKSEIAAGQVQITELKGKLTLNMVDRILFDSGRADVKGDGQKVLDKVGEALNKVQDKDIRIEGHTDAVPIAAALRDRYASNWELSTARATSVARYLIDHASVDPKRLVAAGYGEFRPKAPNDTPEGRAQNRRIEIILVPKD